SGGTAPLDLMLHLIERQMGKDLSVAISEEFILERIRDARDRQRIPLRARVGVKQRKIIEAASLMEANVEDPLSLDDLSGHIGLSRRQLERLFKKHLNCRPVRYYLEVRLARARQLLLQTTMSVTEVTISCGFQSAPHFSKCYKSLYGYSPSVERRKAVTPERPPEVSARQPQHQTKF
ncbi:MAG: helix-turn-helix domain-containing protein, partial [Proteobacteria bacterium]|nr:helix-turn-helix domain-containing protein [Pseudomonadota bacterium]